MKVIVLDDAWPATLLLIREMRRQGIEVMYLSPEVPYSDGIGRYCQQLQAPDMHDPEYRRFLLDVLAKTSFDYLLPICDELQRLVWNLPAEYASRVFPRVDCRTRELFTDRRKMYQFVRALGIPTPRALDLQDVGTLSSIGREFGWPLVLRGTQGHGGSQVKIVNHEAAARSAFLALRHHGSVFAQEFIQGDLYIVGALVDSGHVGQIFMSRVIETGLSPTGPSTRVIAVDEGILRTDASNLFSALRWHGLIQADFIRQANGDYRFLEVNPRLWGSIAAAEVCGAPMLSPFVKLLRGVQLPPSKTHAVGRRITLFPQFVGARIQSGAFPRLADLPHYSAMLSSLCLLSPPLLRHHLRRLYWRWCWSR